MVATADRVKPPSIFDRQVEAALAVWFGPQWAVMIELSGQAAPAPGFTFTPATTGKYFVEVKSTGDTYFGSNNVRYIVANGNILARLSAERATMEATRLLVTDRAPHTLDAAKAQAGNEVIAGEK
jgi:hypothetical protein